jgi:hypothetical protein
MTGWQRRVSISSVLFTLIGACTDGQPATAPDADSSGTADQRVELLGTDSQGHDLPRPSVDLGADLDGSSPSDAMPWTCPTYNGQKLTTTNAAEIVEASGIAASRGNPGVFWIHNDGGAADLYAVDSQGLLLGTYRLKGVVPIDLEDIAVGPGPIPGEHYIYVGDIGDNSVKRASVMVYRVVEPKVTPGTSTVTVDMTGVESFELVYPTTIQLPPPLPSFGGRNAEGLMVDPSSQDIYIVTKRGDEPEEVYLSAAPQDSSQPRKLKLVHSMTIGTGALVSQVDAVSAADISSNGDEIVIRTESTAFLWYRPPGSSVAAALAGKVCVYQLIPEPNGEAITFGLDKDLYTISEGGFQPIYRYQRQ